MSEVAAGSAFIPRHHHHFPLGIGKWKDQLVKPNRQWHVVTQPKWQPVIKNQMVKPSTYTSRISTDLPLYESPGVSDHLSLSSQLGVSFFFFLFFFSSISFDTKLLM